MHDAIAQVASPKAKILLGLLGYYEAILDRKDLDVRLGEIKNLKLGLILDLVKTVDIAEELEEKLTFAIIGAWGMKGKETSLGECEEDIKSMHRCISDVRKSALMTLYNCNPISLMQLDVAVMFSLPLMASDLNAEDVPKIRDLINLIMEAFTEKKRIVHAS